MSFKFLHILIGDSFDVLKTSIQVKIQYADLKLLILEHPSVFQ